MLIINKKPDKKYLVIIRQMNYNYEFNYNISNKKNEISKYTYQNNEAGSRTYIFELIIKDKSNNVKVIRSIKKCNQGKIVSTNDNICYDTINKYKLTVLDINYPDKPTIIKEKVNNFLTTNSYLVKNIYIEINQTTNNMLEFNYSINFN